MPALRLPDALPPGIEVHCLELDLRAGSLAWPGLTPAERERAAGYRQAADRARFAQTRAAARRLLAGRMGCAPAEVPLARGPHGKPYVDAAGAPRFSVSHAGGHALIALAESATVAQIGVDIEQQADDLLDDADGLLALALTGTERAAVAQSDDPIRAFCARWVGKEAVLKAVGAGIGEHLRDVGIRPRADGRLDVLCAVPAWAGVEAATLAAPPGYAAALAWRLKEST